MQPTTTIIDNPSVLALLRGLVPKRQLTFAEGLRIAELQANRLLRHFAIDGPFVPDEIIGELPRIKIERERGLPVSGAAHWNGHYWVITLNADDHPLRQRFSLMHEFKHVLDHTTKDYLYADRLTSSAHQQAERVADYFAACLLMPKRAVKRVWYQGPQDVTRGATMFRVSAAAFRYRLDQIGLTERRRCPGPLTAAPRQARPIGVGGRA
jgi:predicted transcriptional regulator